MPIDKFGRFASGSRREINNFARTIGYSLTPGGHIDVHGRQIKNIGEARESGDAVSRSILESVNQSNHNFIEKIFDKSMQYADDRHKSIIQQVLSSQSEIREVIVTQEGKIRNLINSQYESNEKRLEQIKNDLQSEIARIKEELLLMDKHVQALAAKQNRQKQLDATVAEEEEDTGLRQEPSPPPTEEEMESHWKSMIPNNDETENN